MYAMCRWRNVLDAIHTRLGYESTVILLGNVYIPPTTPSSHSKNMLKIQVKRTAMSVIFNKNVCTDKNEKDKFCVGGKYSV